MDKVRKIRRTMCVYFRTLPGEALEKAACGQFPWVGQNHKQKRPDRGPFSLDKSHSTSRRCSRSCTFWAEEATNPDIVRPDFSGQEWTDGKLSGGQNGWTPA